MHGIPASRRPLRTEQPVWDCNLPTLSDFALLASGDSNMSAAGDGKSSLCPDDFVMVFEATRSQNVTLNRRNFS
jgi:hypothetical protein